MFLLPALLVSRVTQASPYSQKRSATTISLTRRANALEPRKVFDTATAREESRRLLRRYARLSEHGSLQTRASEPGQVSLLDDQDAVYYGNIAGQPNSTSLLRHDDMPQLAIVHSNLHQPLSGDAAPSHHD